MKTKLINSEAKPCKLKRCLFGLFIASVSFVSEAANYQWLKCNPIPDNITIRYTDKKTIYTIKRPSLRELDAIAADGNTVVTPSKDFATQLPPSLRREDFLHVDKNISEC